MTNTFFVSDTHFGHHNILSFKDKEGLPIRPFTSLEEMDEAMVERWNAVVKPQDKVYHLGDVAMNRRHVKTVGRLNGRKVLIKGNHDIFKLNDYTEFFDDIRAYKVMPKHGIIFSHIPVYVGQLQGRFKFNVHGHLHQNLIADPRYLNVCVEHTNYTPVTFDWILETLEKRETDEN